MFNNQTKSENEKWKAGYVFQNKQQEYYVGEGMISFKNGFYSTAETYFRQSISHNKFSYPGHFHLGCALMMMEKMKEAKEHFSICKSLCPSKYEPFMKLGQVLQSLGQYEQSVFNYEKAIRANPQIEDKASYEIGRIYTFHIKDFHKAEDYLWRAYDLNRNEFQYFGILCEMYKQFGRLGDTFLLLSEYFKSDPECPNISYELGKYFHLIRDYPLSEACYLKAIERNPNFPRAVNRLGELYMAWQDYNLAKVQFKRALQLDRKMAIAQINLQKVAKLLFDQALIALRVSNVKSLSFQDEEEFIDRVNIRLEKESTNQSQGKENLGGSIVNKLDIFKSRKGKENQLGSSNRVNLFKSL